MKRKAHITDTAKQKFFRSPYEGANRFSTKAVKAIQKTVRNIHKSLSK